MCQRAAHTLSRTRAPQPPAFNTIVGLASVVLQTRGGLGLAVAASKHVVAPDLLLERIGGPDPLASPDAQAPWGSASTRGCPRPSRGGTDPWWLILSTSSYPYELMKTPDLLERGGGPGTVPPIIIPALSSRSLV
jgi:hypothetical protein